MHKIYTNALLAVLSVTLILLLGKADLKEAPLAEDVSSSTRLPQVIKSIRLDKVYSFAGEPLPRDNFDALERLDRELLVNSYWHSSTILNLKNAARYFAVIEPILSKNKIPDDFKYIAVAESNLRNETSPVGAKGIWQFMTPVAKGYGLEVSQDVDERYNLEKSTEAACRLIRDYYNRFGTWTNAAAAYNIGETRFASEMKRQKMESYYDMNLGAETGRYVFRLIAIKEIMESPQEFGFYLEDQELYTPLNNYKSVKIDSSISDLGEFAANNEISYRIFKIYNPWLISSSLAVPKGKVYDIKIPH